MRNGRWLILPCRGNPVFMPTPTELPLFASQPEGRAAPNVAELPAVTALAELSRLVDRCPTLYIRHSRGPRADLVNGESFDYEFRYHLPGLSVARLSPEPWWPGDTIGWIARRVSQYSQLSRFGRCAWLCRGTVVARGPDHEPVLRNITPVARTARSLLVEAECRYRAAIRAASDPAGIPAADHD